MPDGQRLDLEAERLQTEQSWRRVQDDYVRMAVAAARIFHQVRGSAKVFLSRDDYDDALNIAASALSRLMPIYRLGVDGLRVELAPIDLRTERFARGATQIRCRDRGLIENLSVQRSHTDSAIPLILRAGLAVHLSFASWQDRAISSS
jgi:hypothetical protein